MLTRMTVYMTKQERDAISTIARSEMRDIREQTRWLLRLALDLRGLSQNPAILEPTLETQNERQP